MYVEQDGSKASPPQDASFSQALQDLARAERTATALEQHLDAIEGKIEELLATAERLAREQSTSEGQAADADSHVDPDADTAAAGSHDSNRDA
ncbi:hypothetical protein EJ06DRAFT_15310 [Trichodelitschia bisporula]|uniref:Uncharacterized protein n=1 Tax=Trichodelitschia bisporula TaxID=703511 RepID=A0A6G1IAT7_9PEZI|nr:hypothetical protein EJ06DRAFT_15310 [Trichodelitschia bisporula]